MKNFQILDNFDPFFDSKISTTSILPQIPNVPPRLHQNLPLRPEVRQRPTSKLKSVPIQQEISKNVVSLPSGQTMNSENSASKRANNEDPFADDFFA